MFGVRRGDLISPLLSLFLILSVVAVPIYLVNEVQSKDNSSLFPIEGISDAQFGELEMIGLSHSVGTRNHQTSNEPIWTWVTSTQSGYGDAYGIVVGSNGDVIITGSYQGTVNFGNHSLTSISNSRDIFVAKLNPDGIWQWARSAGGNGNDVARSIAIDSSERFFITGYHRTTASFGNISLTSLGSADLYVAAINKNGSWLWGVNGGSSSDYDSGWDITTNSNNEIYVSGYFTGTAIFGNSTLVSAGNSDIFVGKLSGNGIWDWVVSAGTGSGDWGYGIAVDSFGSAFVVAEGNGGANFGGLTATGYGQSDIFVAKVNSSGVWDWVISAGSSGNDNALTIYLDSNEDIFLSGYATGTTTFGNLVLSPGGSNFAFVAKVSPTGNWLWVAQTTGTGPVYPLDLTIDLNGNALITGYLGDGTTSFGSTNLPSNGNSIFVAKISTNGSWQWAIKIYSSSPPNTVGRGIISDSYGNISVVGEIAGTVSFGTIGIHAPSSSPFVARLSPDHDGDAIADIYDTDDDADTLADVSDSCPFSEIGFIVNGFTDHDSDGCRDWDEDSDDDDDSIEDGVDSCPKGVVGWTSDNISDFDGDGCMDIAEDPDDDGDGFVDYLDLCPITAGNSTLEGEKGCPDSDGDGRPDIRDAFPNDSSEWSDLDGDGVGDNLDEFPLDATQHVDSDADGFGDYQYGNAGDSCPTEFGNSTVDRFGCPDNDGDGISDLNDEFPEDPTKWQDSDRDGVEDSEDKFPFDPTQVSDRDGDGYGDNPTGNLPDAFPDDPEFHTDRDSDGTPDGLDDFPLDPTQQSDRDGDGFGDNDRGSNADKFPDDSSQWSDIDGDGYGDNRTGNNSDAFIADPTQWSDSDGDGYGDNPFGRGTDAFPNDATQWDDLDGDGFGDNQSGNDPDPYLFDFDNDGYNDSIDPLPKLASPGDMDNDGCPEGEDLFPDDFRECSDFDEDGIGDNADPDDDNDGWVDTDEVRQGTDPFDASDYPVDVFQLVIPGTTIGLDGWDLIGIFGGVPLFAWIMFGFITRNSRANRFEAQLKAARSKEELEEIALRSEYALMIRMIGAHQGIRLERLRAELDDALGAESSPFDEDMTRIVEQDMAQQGKPVDTVPGFTDVPSSDTIGIVGEDGYEWLEQGGLTWYRPAGSKSVWNEWTQ